MLERISIHFEGINIDKEKFSKNFRDKGLNSFIDIAGKVRPKLLGMILLDIMEDGILKPFYFGVSISEDHPFKQEILENYPEDLAVKKSDNYEQLNEQLNEQLKMQLEKYKINSELTLETFNNSEESTLFEEFITNNDDQAGASFECIINNIFKLFKSDFGNFKDAIYKLLCYAIKRQQSLLKFGDRIQFESTECQIHDLSLKMLIHNLYVHSTPFLRQKLILLLSVFNPIPFVVPKLEEGVQKIGYQLVNEAFLDIG